jgi:hypothetical protein
MVNLTFKINGSEEVAKKSKLGFDEIYVSSQSLASVELTSKFVNAHRYNLHCLVKNRFKNDPTTVEYETIKESDLRAEIHSGIYILACSFLAVEGSNTETEVDNHVCETYAHSEQDWQDKIDLFATALLVHLRKITADGKDTCMPLVIDVCSRAMATVLQVSGLRLETAITRLKEEYQLMQDDELQNVSEDAAVNNDPIH